MTLAPLQLVGTTLRRVRGLSRVVRFKVEAECSTASAVARWARRRGGNVALLFEGRTWTYRELDQLIDRRAAALDGWGIRRGDTVAVMIDNRPGFIADTLAVNRLGAVPALINTKLSGAGLRHAVAVVAPKAMVVGGEHLLTMRTAFKEHRDELDLGVLVDWEDVPTHELEASEVDFRDLVKQSGSRRAPGVSTRGDDLAAYIYTSGTTGLPKAGKVLHARCALAGYGFGGIAMGLSPRDVVYCCLPMFHSNGFIVAMASAFFHGSTFALARKFSASRFWDDVRQTRATAFIYIGEICRYLVNQPPSPSDADNGLRRMVGNGLRPEVWTEFERRFQPGRIHEFYGATEGNVNMVNLRGRLGSVGKIPPLFDNTLLVRFDNERQAPVRGPDGFCIPCARGEIGELLGKINPKLVSQRFDGYADESATEKKILRNVREHGDAYFRSGDLLRQDKNGYYYFVDRIGDTFRWKGENVSTNEVADALQRYDGVEMANVYGVKIGESDGRAGMVTLVMSDGATFDPGAFYRHVSGQLAEFARPAFVRLATDVPLTATFKLKKVALVRDGFDPAAVEEPLFYRDDDAKTFRPLGPAEHGRILAGEVRL